MKTPNRLIPRVSVFLAAGVLLAACGGSAAPAGSSALSSAAAKPAGSAAPAASSKPAASAAAAASASAGAATKAGRVRLMELPSVVDPNLSYPLETQELGLFKKHGVDVEVMHAGGGGPQKVQILVSGSADIVMTDIIAQYSGQYQGADYKAFFAPVARFGVPIAAANDITSMQQLKGKEVAVPSLAGAGRFLIDLAFAHFGLKDSDVKWLAIPGAPNSLKAIVSGRVPAGYISTAAIPLIEQDAEYKSKVHVLLPTTAAYTKPWPNFEYIAKKSWLQQNQDAVQRITEASLEMERTFAKDQNQYATIANKIYPELKVDQAKEAWKLLTDTGNWAENGGINFDGLQTALETYLQQQKLQPNQNLSKAQDGFDTAPLKSALDKLGVISDSKDAPDWYKK